MILCKVGEIAIEGNASIGHASEFCAPFRKLLDGVIIAVIGVWVGTIASINKIF